jgi:hypothetical protein
MNVKKNIELLGLKAQDKVTGFKGVITSISFDLYGCVQAVVNPGTDKTGKPVDSHWFDVSRLKVTSTTPVMERPDFNFGVEKGPAEKPAMTKV